MNSHEWHRLLAFGLFLATIFQAAQAMVPPAPDESGQFQAPVGAGGRFEAVAPRSSPLISWDSYTRMYNKNYSSLSQLSARQKIFVAQAMRAFVTSVKYMLNQLPYHLSVNEFSDLTPEEGTQLLSGAADGADEHHGGRRDDDGDDGDDDDDGILSDEDARRLLLEELDEYGSDDETEEHLIEHKKSERAKHGARRRASRRRTKRWLFGSITRRLTLSDLIRRPRQSKRPEPANVRWIVPPTNENYRPPRATSGQPDRNEEEPMWLRVDDIPEDKLAQVDGIVSSNVDDEQLAEPIQLAPGPGLIGRLTGSIGGTISGAYNHLVGQYAELFSSANDPANADEAARALEAREINKETMFRDWRDSGCISPPMNQGKCMSCYAISTMSYVEWAFCKSQHKILTPLSTQYMINCGPQYKMETNGTRKLSGCRESFTKHAMWFVQDYGVELEAHMPYVARDNACPVAPFTPPKQKGYIRPNVRKSVRMDWNTSQLDLALKLGPVIVVMREPVDFLAYGGGMVNRCYPRASHAMLVVGNGFDEGEEYLLIKNSFGTNWGINGYFKFQLSAVKGCVREFISPRVSFPGKKAQQRRVKAYVAQKAQSLGGEADNQLADGDDDIFASSDSLNNLFDVGQGGLLNRLKNLWS